MFEYLAIDWGEKRFGLAFGTKTSSLIIPSTKENFTDKIFEVLIKEVKERKTKEIVVGIPTNKTLENTEVTAKIQDFIKKMQLHFPGIIINTINERNSTKNSKNLLHSKNRDKHFINNLAAGQILEYYFQQLTKSE